MALLRCLLLAAGVFLVALPAPAQSLRDVPPLQARVTDLTGTLSERDRDALISTLAALERETGSQVVVLLVDSTRPEAIEQYAIRVAEAWQLGRSGVDDGVLILVALDDRRIRIEVGYGLEGVLPDARTNRIIDEAMTPAFARGEIAEGLAAGIAAIANGVRGEALPAPAAQRGVPDINGLLPILLIIGLTLGGVLKRAFGALPGAAVAGGIVGVIVWFLVGIILTACVAGVVAFLAVLFMSAGPGGWSSGRGYGGGFGGGFGGRGGFSGGGGRFGGGGASGGW